jgi:VanZ family protein
MFSTGWFTGENTGGFIIPLLAALFPGASPATLAALHHLIRKSAHFVEYLVLSVLLFRALRRSSPRSRLSAAGIAIAIAAVYAVGDEIHQAFVPGRTAAALDCVIDLTGAAAGQGLVAVVGQLVRR